MKRTGFPLIRISVSTKLTNHYAGVRESIEMYILHPNGKANHELHVIAYVLSIMMVSKSSPSL